MWQVQAEVERGSSARDATHRERLLTIVKSILEAERGSVRLSEVFLLTLIMAPLGGCAEGLEMVGDDREIGRRLGQVVFLATG